MEVFRITLKKWSGELKGSGYPARWNSKGKFVIYTSNSRALASLENVVHRSGEGLNQNFRTMVIHIPDEIAHSAYHQSDLKSNWFQHHNLRYTQNLGDQWYDECETVVLKIPSAIVKLEYNYLLNPRHPDFEKIKIIGTEEFDFDPRIKI